jgi:hypothetical protein
MNTNKESTTILYENDSVLNIAVSVMIQTDIGHCVVE